MFLDSGNIISDHTFYAQTQIMVENFPNFRQNLSDFVRGWQLVVDPQGSCDTNSH